MITIFRRIREKLITSGSVTKYLFYAIGEILLVVIGILIALQVNNWNEAQKRIEQEKYLIRELKKEFENNLLLIDEDIRTNQAGLDGTLQFLKLVQDRGLEKNRGLSDSLIVHIYEINTFEPVSGIIDDVVGTGKLDLIQDDSLRRELANWAGRNVDLYDDIDIRNNYLFDIMVPFITKHYPLVNTREVYSDVSLKSPYWEQLSDSDNTIDLNAMYSAELEGHLYNHALNQEYVISGTNIYRSYIISVLGLIDKQ